MFWPIVGILFVAFIAYSIYEMRTIYPKGTWFAEKEFSLDNTYPQYLRVSERISSSCINSDDHFFYEYFEPDGTIKRDWGYGGHLKKYAPLFVNTLEDAYQKQIENDIKAQGKEKEDMQAKALKSFLKKGKS